MEAKIYSVDTVNYHLNKSIPPNLVVTASGTVNSSGWKEGRLIPWTYKKMPTDGIVDFDFIATYPEENVIWLFSTIESIPLTITFHNWIKGIRVHAANGNKEFQFKPGQGNESNFVLLGGTDDGEPAPFPWFPNESE